MKLVNRNVEMTCTLVLSEREIEMLGYLAGFGANNIAQAIAKELTSRWPKDEWETLWSELRRELERTASHYSNVRAVFSGTKVATEPERTSGGKGQ